MDTLQNKFKPNHSIHTKCSSFLSVLLMHCLPPKEMERLLIAEELNELWMVIRWLVKMEKKKYVLKLRNTF